MEDGTFVGMWRCEVWFTCFGRKIYRQHTGVQPEFCTSADWLVSELFRISAVSYYTGIAEILVSY